MPQIQGFAEQLKRLVTLTNLSQTKFCRKYDLEYKAFVAWVQGRNVPRADNFVKIISAIGRPAIGLFSTLGMKEDQMKPFFGRRRKAK